MDDRASRKLCDFLCVCVVRGGVVWWCHGRVVCWSTGGRSGESGLEAARRRDDHKLMILTDHVGGQELVRDDDAKHMWVASFTMQQKYIGTCNTQGQPKSQGTRAAVRRFLQSGIRADRYSRDDRSKSTGMGTVDSNVIHSL